MSDELEEQTCGRRMTEMGPWDRKEGLDKWITDRWTTDEEKALRDVQEFEEKNPGSHASSHFWNWGWGPPRTCNFCGGIHPEDAIKLLSEEWEAEGTGKGYKVYLNPPGTSTKHEAFMASMRDHSREMGEGVPSVWSPTPPVKVYFQHFTKEQGERWNQLLAEKKKKS